MPYFCRKLGKVSQNLSSAVVVMVVKKTIDYSLDFAIA